MITVLLAVLIAFLAGWGFEGTVRVNGPLANNLLQLGRVRVATWTYRPGRVYVRVGIGGQYGARCVFQG